MRPSKAWMTVVLVCYCAGMAANAQILLRERAINLDGSVSDDPFGSPLPTLGGSFSGVIDTGSGLGTMTISVSGAGSHDLSAFLDHDIDKSINTSFNELGSAFGSPSPGQSWELGSPRSSSILSDFSASSLTDSSLLTGAGVKGGDDVAMALGWGFILGANEVAQVSWTASLTQPPGGFYLEQIDPDSSKTIFFTSSLDIRQLGSIVPDGGSTVGFLGASLGILQLLRMRRQQMTPPEARMPCTRDSRLFRSAY